MFNDKWQFVECSDRSVRWSQTYQDRSAAKLIGQQTQPKTEISLVSYNETKTHIHVYIIKIDFIMCNTCESYLCSCQLNDERCTVFEPKTSDPVAMYKVSVFVCVSFLALIGDYKLKTYIFSSNYSVNKYYMIVRICSVCECYSNWVDLSVCRTPGNCS